ncbi:MAG: SDR family NAD(P)-dependent oxidoreductase [Bryobacteraceae bacterium]
MESRVVIVSGGSRGLGKGFVGALLDAGHRVATFSRSPTEFIRELQSAPELKERFLYESVDTRNPESLKSFVDTAKRPIGRIDILVNNAGIARDGILAIFSEENIDEVIDVNLKSSIRLTKYCVRHMLLERRGRIINISSIIGITGYRGLSVYAATKAGLDAITRSLARELGSRGILVNSIAPGYMRTEMTHGLDEAQMGQIVRRTPLGRLGETSDVCPLLVFLCSDQSSFITGQVFVVDGGLTA